MIRQRSRGGSAALWGIIMGLILAALVVLHQLVVAGVTRRAVGPGASLLFTALALLIAAALYFLAGFLAARRANAIEAGVFAGLIAGAIVGMAVLAIAVLALVLRDHRIAAATARHPALVRAAIASGVARAVLGVLVQALVGAGLGALGGLAGRRRTPPTAAGAPGPYTQPAPPAPPSSPYAYPPATPPLGDDAPTITPQR